jgi:hypothetical protein
MKNILTRTLTTIAMLGIFCAVPSMADNIKPYPKKTCVVSGNKLGSMGPVVTKTHESQQVKFCCKPCVAKFNKNPGKYLQDL